MSHVYAITLPPDPNNPEAQQFELPVAPDGQLLIIPSNLNSCFRAGGYLVSLGRGGVDVGWLVAMDDLRKSVVVFLGFDLHVVIVAVGNIDDWKELCGKEGAVVSGRDGGDAGRVAADEVEVTRGLPSRSVGIGSSGCVESDIDPAAVFEQRWGDG